MKVHLVGQGASLGRQPALFAALIVLCGTGAVCACSVPVFRYALEHWIPDPYTAIVFHKGPLTAEQRAMITTLQHRGPDGRPEANLQIEEVDLSGADIPDAMTALWSDQNTDTLPWVVIQSLQKVETPTMLWSGELTEESVATVHTSAAREELRERLLSGHSVVWVFLESGDAARDDQSYGILQSEVARLEQVLELPAIEEADLKDLSLDPAALKLKMSTLRLSRNDPAEGLLTEMLLHVEPDLREPEFVNQPMVFPVFGRGRALYALVGDGITAGTIEDAARFLTGGCQCTVKAQNPGVDLLMAVPWDQFVQPSKPDSEPPVLTGFGGFASAPSVQETTAEQTAPDATSESVDSLTATAVDSASSPGSVSSTPADDEGDHKAAAVKTETAEPIRVSELGINELAPSGRPAAAASPETNLATPILLVVGLLAMGVIAVSLVLLPRAR